MTGSLHAPPGRAGRQWLHHRLMTARQGADLLDHKLRVLRTERERLALQEERTARTWQAASREADSWLLRGVLLGGERAVRLSADRGHTEVEVGWEQRMGVRFPGEATCTPPEPSPDAPAVVNAALLMARDSHIRALDAAVQQAVVEAAVRVLQAEELTTRRRLRAIEDRWIPRLEKTLAEVQLRLEEEEHSDGVRLRWARERPARDARELHGGGSG